MMRTVQVGLAAAFLVVSLAEVDQADAATLRYRASGDWTLITDGASPGWGPNPTGVGTSLPGAGDDARINFGNNVVTVTSSVPAVNRVQIGVDESGNVVVESGGTLTSNGDTLAGNNNAAAKGTLTVNSGGTVNVGNILWSANGGSDGDITVNAGGQINVGNHLWLGATGTSIVNISGTLNQTGGILGLGTTNASTPSGGTATVNVTSGGLLALNNISSAAGLPSVQSGSLLNITGTGEITLPGDFLGVLQNYEDAGKLVGDLGASDVTIDLVKNPGFTTAYISAIPEPSTVLLIGLGLGLAFVARRR